MKSIVRKNVGRCLTTCAAAVLFMAVMAGCGKREPVFPSSPIPPREPPPEGYVWTELPEITDKENCVVITHRETFGGVYGRSFTMLYDTGQKLSHWVAYPLHNIYFKTTGGVRTDNFSYDPQISSSYQMPITGNGYGGGYDRGHQIASADRNINEVQNDQTFFITNMTPQNRTLNQGQWSDLEQWVRSVAWLDREAGWQYRGNVRYDTLYVVTGCVTGGNTITVRGVKGAVPQAYYKVLLRTRSGLPHFPKDGDAMCIGFWMDNKAPSGSWRNYVVSVAEVERKTGFTFFPSLSADAKKSYDTADWEGF